MTAPALSILVPSIGERTEQARELFAKLEWQAAGASVTSSHRAADVEVVMLTDNRKRSVGAKRQALLDIARGRYVVYVDDDDDVADTFVCRLCEGIDAELDVVVIYATCQIEDSPAALVEMDIHNPNEQPQPARFRRKPWMCCAWRRKLAVQSWFPDVQYGEDAVWLIPLWQLASTQFVIKEPLYHYRWSAKTSATLGATP